MARLTFFLMSAALLAFSVPADAQGRQQDRRDRNEAARAQGIPPGHMPPADQCRVWYDNRSNGRQPAATSCRQAEAIAMRDRNARVVYGHDVFWSRDRDGRYDDRDRDGYGRYDNDRAVPRGSVRDPRISGGIIDRDGRYGRDGRLDGNPAFRNGYRDGLTKGREDAEDGDRYDVNRHSWYRSANRGYENEHGTRYDYIADYRRGFEAGYGEGYRVYRRR